MTLNDGQPTAATRFRRLTTAELSPSEIEAIRALLWSAFPPDGEEAFSEDDWDHAVGGVHFVLFQARDVIAHASIVERELHVGERSLRAGYVEAVAVDPGRQGRGYGSRLMGSVGAEIQARFDLGALGTGSHHFYERLGWRTWLGPSSVRTADGPVRTPDDDGYLMVLDVPRLALLDRTAPISCDWRPGDVW